MQKIFGKFITVEGGEGVGKSTVLHFIKDYLVRLGVNVKVTREPGGTLIADQIRHLLLSHHDEHMDQDTELLLMFSSRAQHLSQFILPSLQEGAWVVCDRFTDSTYAYQGGGRGIDVNRIATLETWVQGDIRPDYTILLDAPVEVGLERAKNRGAFDRIEVEDQKFFERVRQMYLSLAEKAPERYRVVDASRDIKQVYAQIEVILKSILS
jgi:dTMP kinase